MYKLNKSILTSEVTSVIKEENNIRIYIPFDPENTDYQAYLKWVEAGNTPEPAEIGRAHV